jgi:predicted enzyme related to lactoylglutathione lyase
MPNYWFDHIHIFGPDREELAKFYVEKFGAKIIDRRSFGEDRIAVHVDLNGTEILCSQANDSHAAGLHHIGIRTDDLPKAIKELKKKGVEFMSGIIDAPPKFHLAHMKAMPENVDIELQDGTIYDLPLVK